MGRVKEIGEQMWYGDGVNTLDFSSGDNNISEEYSPELLFVFSFANVLAIDCGPSIVLVDVGSVVFCANVHELVRSWTKKPISHVIYTHHHVDHVFGTAIYEGEQGSPVTVVAQEKVVANFDRYKYTGGYNGHINQRQFQLENPMFPPDFRYPNVTYRDSMTLTIGDQALELNHGMGETDDATWVWIPKLRALAVGDLFIWCCPNCGNPAKVQRYCREWAEAMRTMMGKKAQFLFPGHGPPIVGEERIQQVLGETATYLEAIEEQTVALMNQGCTLDQIIAQVKPHSELSKRSYLKPVYDDPEFIVRNIWRKYGGWFDGNPARLQAPSDRVLAESVSSIAGGAVSLANRAKQMDKDKDEERRVARQLVEWAHLADGQNPRVAEVRRDIYEQSAEKATALMSKGVYTSAKKESERVLEAKL
eukprot:CAMPEP_0201490838 /NCGR_PEP_ID=MMETSP0151_2-20130828/27630_1 /ASSEMBLY_ACC=CAM_ASM_000257 /TAXON_ID=200890 /ORGANISM="Paramoeba atlantica, Strain 621/1 / CCAP 1560/9" /LENGTH=419 /DNA_ID=CAMNT_0047876945 /DNA_START=61 /DNA_END=1320 /DNA_ORIENTATION=-